MTTEQLRACTLMIHSIHIASIDTLSYICHFLYECIYYHMCKHIFDVWSDNVSHRLSFENFISSWGGFGGVALMEEVFHLGQVMRFQCLMLFSEALSASWLYLEMWELSCLPTESYWQNPLEPQGRISHSFYKLHWSCFFLITAIEKYQ